MTDKEDEKIVALTSTVKKQEKDLDKLTQILLQAQNKRKQSNGSNKRKIREQDKWKYVPPADGQSDTKTGPNGKTYHWCVYHLMWCIHTSDQCNKKIKGFDIPVEESENKKKSPSNKFPHTTKAYSACMTLDDILASIDEEEE